MEKLPSLKRRKRKRSLIGLDLGSTAIKAVEMHLTDDGPVVTGVAHRDILPGEDFQEALAALLEESGFTAKETATAVSGRSVVVRHLATAKMDDDDLKQAMGFEADKLLPFEPDEILMDCQRLEREPQLGGDDDEGDGDRIGVVLVACRDTLIEEQYRGVLGVGLTPVAIDAEAFALVNAFEFCNGELANTELDEDDEDSEEPLAELPDEVSAEEPAQLLDDPYGVVDEDSDEELDDPYGEPHDEGDFDPFTGVGVVDATKPPPLSGSAVAIADVGATRTQISVVIGGESCFSREIGVGGVDMTQAIARRLGVEQEEAEQIKRMPEDHEQEIVEALESVIDDLVGELSLSLDFVENHEGITVGRVLMTGGGARTPGLLEGVIRGTGREAATWDLFEKVIVDTERVDSDQLRQLGPSLAVAVGLAARVTAA
ncbi:MAG: pilus assembly protein PilM [Planctomycetota bacterium]|nr:pilus assembly protein PilM [Planctomycetota bacterium]